MSTFKSTIKTAQDYTNVASRPAADKKLLVARGSYTLAGTEAANDVIELVKLPAGAEVLPTQSSFICDASVATALVAKVGTDSDDDAFSTVTTLTSGGVIGFTAGTNGVEVVNPVAKTDSYTVQLKLSTSTSPTAGKKIGFAISYLV